jgi:hypothetical protein
MRPSALDTSPDIDARHFELYRRMTPADKARRLSDLTQGSCQLALAGLRSRHPAADEQELLLRLTVLRLGEEIVARVYGGMAPDRLPEPIQIALAVAAQLERLRIPYVAVGSLASSVHGEPRSTDDIDFVVDLQSAAIPNLVAALATDYYVSPEATAAAAAQARGGTFNAIHLSSAVKVDFFVAGSDPFDAERLAARERVHLGESPAAELFVDTAEHTVLRKLEWYRRGGEVSDRQWRDVIGVLRAQRGRLKEASMKAWAERLGVSDLLARAVTAAE